MAFVMTMVVGASMMGAVYGVTYAITALLYRVRPTLHTDRYAAPRFVHQLFVVLGVIASLLVGILVRMVGGF